MTAPDEKVLVVEDDAALRELLVQELADRGYSVRDAGDKAGALNRLQSGAFDLVVSDIRLPDGSGLDILKAAHSGDNVPAVILITAFGSVPQAVDALKAGADDFLTKPLDLDHLAVRVDRVLANRRTGVTLATLQESLRNSSGSGNFHGMVGDSPMMRKLYDAIRHIARVDEPVLISGESGTGKELVARAIHAQSNRADAPFVAINCASVPETLLEAEFFGHTAGAFTGAGTAREGLFSEANGGILFMDEIGEMPMSMQAKLLRVLQDGVVRPLGGGQEITVDVRIVAATNRDIEAAVKEGEWREDLFYRLEILSLTVPPLRERPDDLLTLATHFLTRIAVERGLQELRLTERALDAIMNYPFPGNVRELGNAMARAATFCEGSRIDVQHLPKRMRAAGKVPDQDGDPLGITKLPLPTLEQVERRYIEWVLAHAGNNKRRTAEILDVGRRTIYRKLGGTA